MKLRTVTTMLVSAALAFGQLSSGGIGNEIQQYDMRHAVMARLHGWWMAIHAMLAAL